MEKKKILIIGCAIMKDELVHGQPDGISFTFLEQSLHRTPQKMKEAIQEEINKAEGWEGDSIILSYGLCSNGIVGIKANRHTLVIPRVHDCITLFLGARERYLEEHQKEPGTYYLTRGWIDEKKSPLGIYEEYCQKYGKETAEWAIREELKNYTRIALVESELGVSDAHRKHARENAHFLNLRYEEIKGSLDFFRKIIQGPWDKDFVVLKPGEEATQEIFLE
ncbi:MAG: DUF1638 domain-containing protein [Thermodesulfobacteriota bacterium]|jgi:hypothetical protein